MRKRKEGRMIVDVFAMMDDAPFHLRRPLLPVPPLPPFLYRVPLFVGYGPRAAGWPEVSWYPTNADFYVHAVLINGHRFQKDPSAGPAPAANMFKLHVELDATYICAHLDMGLLWQYERPETIATENAMFSLLGSKERDGEPNPPMIAKPPAAINKKADALRYARMSFEQKAVAFIKDRQSIYLYGGEMILSLRHRDEHGDGPDSEHPIGHYIMTGIDHDKAMAKVTAVDFRYLLNAKYPHNTFTRDGSGGSPALPFLEDRHEGEVMPEMIGIGNGIPGVCLNGLQIYSNFPTKIERYTYRFPPGFIIDGNFKIEVRMNGNAPADDSPATFDDTWVEVFPGLGNPRLADVGDGSLFAYRPDNPLLGREDVGTFIEPDKGLVHIHFRQALKNGRYGNDPNDARMFARWPDAGMYDAMHHLLKLTGNEKVHGQFTGEFAGLADVGLFMDSSESVFTWVERLQAANVLGGQLLLDDGALRFRLENPNRDRRLDIPRADVLNHEELAVGIAEDFMYSGWDIAWKKSHADGNEGRIIGTNARYPAAPILNGVDLTTRYVRQVSEVDGQTRITEGFDTSHAQRRARIIRELVNTFRHRCRGVRLPMTREYLGLRIFDVVGYLPRALEDARHEPLEWMIYQKKIDVADETITLDLVQRVRSRNWNDGNE